MGSAQVPGVGQGALKVSVGCSKVGGARLPSSVCRAAPESALRRVKLCLERNGGHVEHVPVAPK